MHRLPALALTVLMSAVLTASAADPKDTVKAAAKKLGEQSYSFSSTPKADAASGGGKRGRVQAPMDGEVAKDGLIHLVTRAGENSIDSYLKPGKGAIKTPDGWKSLAEIQQSAQDGGGAQRNPAMFIALLFRNYKTPVVQATELADNSSELKETDGAFAGDLTEAGAKGLLSFGRPGAGGPEISGARGAVKFWVKDGQLARMETHVEGKVNFNGNDFDVNRTTVIEIKEIGSVKITVPDEAKAKLE